MLEDLSPTPSSLQVGSDDDGYAVRMKLSNYLRYIHSPRHGQVDDSPLYIFDGSFAEKETSKGLSEDYEVPVFFNESLMHYAGERRRPPYRFGAVC